MTFVYMVKNLADKLYIGISDNPEERVVYHNSKQGSRFTRYIPNYKIVFLEKYNTFSQARKREIQIKKWRREKKEILIEKYQRGQETRL